MLYDLDMDQEELIPPYEKKPERQYFLVFCLPYQLNVTAMTWGS